MNRYDTALLAIRLAAIYAWFMAIEYVAGGAIAFFFAQSKLFGSAGVSVVLIYIFPCAVMIGAGLFLFMKAPTLAHRFLPAAHDGVSAAKPAPVSLAFAIVGLAVFLYALPHVIGECMGLLRSQQFLHGDAQQQFLRSLPQIAGSTVQLICGFLLFVRPHRLARWWERKREATVSV